MSDELIIRFNDTVNNNNDDLSYTFEELSLRNSIRIVLNEFNKTFTKVTEDEFKEFCVAQLDLLKQHMNSINFYYDNLHIDNNIIEIIMQKDYIFRGYTGNTSTGDANFSMNGCLDITVEKIFKTDLSRYTIVPTIISYLKYSEGYITDLSEETYIEVDLDNYNEELLNYEILSDGKLYINSPFSLKEDYTNYIIDLSSNSEIEELSEIYYGVIEDDYTTERNIDITLFYGVSNYNINEFILKPLNVFSKVDNLYATLNMELIVPQEDQIYIYYDYDINKPIILYNVTCNSNEMGILCGKYNGKLYYKGNFTVEDKDIKFYYLNNVDSDYDPKNCKLIDCKYIEKYPDYDDYIGRMNSTITLPEEIQEGQKYYELTNYIVELQLEQNIIEVDNFSILEYQEIYGNKENIIKIKNTNIKEIENLKFDSVYFKGNCGEQFKIVILYNYNKDEYENCYYEEMQTISEQYEISISNNLLTDIITIKGVKENNTYNDSYYIEYIPITSLYY